MANERYKIIKTIDHVEWLDGCPVKLCKSQLLIDNQSGKVVLQNKIQNISDIEIKSIFLDVDCFDDAMDPLDALIDVAYQSIAAKPRDFFGSRQPIAMKDSKTTNVKIYVKKIVFADDSVWRNESKESGVILPQQAKIDTSDILIAQITRECATINIVPLFWPDSELDYWRCTCGNANILNKTKCSSCGATKDWLDKHFKKQYLLEEKDKYEAEQETIRKESQDASDLKAKNAELSKTQKKRQIIKTAIVTLIVMVFVISTILVLNVVIIPSYKYSKAMGLVENKQYSEAASRFKELGNYKDSNNQFNESQYKYAEYLLSNGKDLEAQKMFSSINNYKDSLLQQMKIVKKYSTLIGAGYFHTVGLKSDGMLISVGDNQNKQRYIDDWVNIISVDAGFYHTVGLRSDGTVVAVGYNYYGQCNVDKWTNIKTISADIHNTAGLKEDGTVIVVGDNSSKQCETNDWTDISAISSGGDHTVGLKLDGTVVAVGNNENKQCDVNEWTNIVSICAGKYTTLGLKSDGTVVATGLIYLFNIDSWQNIIAISLKMDTAVGLKSDGTVVATGDSNHGKTNVSAWTDIIAIQAGVSNTFGLKSDGTVVAVGNNDYGQCNVSSWENIFPKK